MNEKTASPSARARNIFFPPWAAVLLLASVLMFFRLGERPFRNPDEGRYADIAHEMVLSGDWVKPTVFGIAYLRKPPLFYWLLAGSFKLFGENEWTARTVPAVFGISGVLLVFFFTRRFFDEQSAVLASLILATNAWYVQVSRYLVIDAVFTFFLTACLFVFYAAFYSQSRQRALFLIFYLLLGAAFLTKGPAALATVGLPIFFYLMSTRRLKELSRFHLLTGGIIFLCVAAPWFWAMARREPWFPGFFFGHENLKRFVSADFEHQEPWYYYAVMLPVLFLPWTLYAKPWIRREAGTKDPLGFLLLSAAVIVVFYSLSRSKLPTYILPCLPLLSVAAGVAWKRWMDSRPVLGKYEILPAAAVLLTVVFVMAGSNIYLASRADRMPPGLLQDVYWLAGTCIAGSILSLRSIKMKRPGRLFMSLILMMSALDLLVPRLMERVNPSYTAQAFAYELKGRVSPADEVFIYDHPGPFYDFLFYLGRPVKLVGLEGELVYSNQDTAVADRTISREDFFARLRENKKMFVLMRRSDYRELEGPLRAKLKVLKQDQRKVLVES